MDLQVVTELSYCYSISAATMTMIIREVGAIQSLIYSDSLEKP